VTFVNDDKNLCLIVYYLLKLKVEWGRKIIDGIFL
jgi:hypothetical protein